MSTAYTIGLDLGQANDFSALAVLEHVDLVPPGAWVRNHEPANPVLVGAWGHDAARTSGPDVQPTRELRVVHLQRWPLGTPYHVIVGEVGNLVRTEELYGSRMYFDRSGVGRPVGDMLWECYARGEFGDSMPVGQTITGGEKSGNGTVTKRDLISALEIAVQQGRLKIPTGLALVDVLERELSSFKMHLSAKNGREKYDIERRTGEGHGDIVIAVALAAMHPDFDVVPRWDTAPHA